MFFFFLGVDLEVCVIDGVILLYVVVECGYYESIEIFLDVGVSVCVEINFEKIILLYLSV